MGENSKIEWCDHTFNPWTRCTPVSPACDHCYAETWAGRATHPKDAQGRALPIWGADAPRTPTSAHNWKQPLRWNAEALAAGEPRFVFCGSLCDIGEDRPDLVEPRARLVKLIETTPGLVWLLLTKRPENLTRLFPEWADGWPVNVWVGATVEDQERADERIRHLLKVPARRRFLSVEPLLEDVDLGLDCIERDDEDEPVYLHNRKAMHPCDYACGGVEICGGIDWVIAGGESGPKARPMRPDWARSIRDQCIEAGVPFLFKQWGEHDEHGRRVGKKLAGRLLDGRTWDERPAPIGGAR